MVSNVLNVWPWDSAKVVYQYHTTASRSITLFMLNAVTFFLLLNMVFKASSQSISLLSLGFCKPCFLIYFHNIFTTFGLLKTQLAQDEPPRHNQNVEPLIKVAAVVAAVNLVKVLRKVVGFKPLCYCHLFYLNFWGALQFCRVQRSLPWFGSTSKLMDCKIPLRKLRSYLMKITQKSLEMPQSIVLEWLLWVLSPCGYVVLLLFWVAMSTTNACFRHKL